MKLDALLRAAAPVADVAGDGIGIMASLRALAAYLRPTRRRGGLERFPGLASGGSRVDRVRCRAVLARRAGRRARRWVAVVLAPVTAVGTTLAPAGAAVVAGVGIAAVSAVAAAAPANAATPGPVLVLLQNGETTAPETTVLQNAGYSVTQVTPSTWQGMSTSQFQGYAALVIGDPSAGGSCSTLTPTTGTTGSDALGTNWQAAVTGNVAVLGTAPALPGTSAANTLISDAASYVAAGYSSSNSTGTGLYVSLNCEYSTAPAGTSVPLLNGVEGIGAAGGLSVQGSLSCSDAGTVNTWEAVAAGTFGGFTSSQLSGSSWPSPACPVQEAFGTWPAMFTPLAYDTAADAAATFTASDGATGQPYVLLGAPVSSATAALAPSAGGEVLAGTTTGGTSNPAAPGVQQASAGDPVNTENGDFAQSGTDLSIPGFGPSLGFARTYDAGVAQQQTQAGRPGPMGYGWTDNWASSLATASPVPGDIYAAGGLRTGNGNGGPGSQSVVQLPGNTYVDGSGDTYIADTQDNRVQEIAGSTGTQWGISMTAGDVYTVAGSPAGYLPNFTGLANGTPAAQTRLNHPGGVAVNSSGLYIADTLDCRVVEIAATTGTQWGISMTAGDLYTVAGVTGSCGASGDGGPAASADLNEPASIHFGAGSHAGDLYIADWQNNRIQEVAASGGTEWGQSMTANDIYTVIGSSTGASGMSGNGTRASSALLNAPKGVTIDGSGDMLIADTNNCRIVEVPWSSGTYWGISGMIAGDMYTVAGRGGSNNCTIGNDNKSQLQSNLNYPVAVRDPNGNMYIADTANNRVQEVAGTTHAEFGQNMTADFVYTVAGSSAGTGGDSGDGGAAASALLNNPGAVWLDAAGNIYVSDTGNNEVRKVTKSTATISDLAGNGHTLLNTGDGGPAVLSGLYNPGAVASDAHGDVFIADAGNNRVQEIAASSHTQFGVAMTAGDIYTVAGSSTGAVGYAGDGGPATSALLNDPFAVALDSSGNLYIADEGNAIVREVSAATRNISTVAGTPGMPGYFGDGGPATSAVLATPDAIAVDASGDVFIADSTNSLVQEIPATSGTYYGTAMTAGDIYAIAGIPQQPGDSGDGGAASSATLGQPTGLAVDATGNVYISDASYNRVREVAAANGAHWGQPMTGGDIYGVAGSASGTSGNTGDGGPAAAALLQGPAQIALDAAGDLYITDSGNARVREIAAANGTQWSQSMTAGDIYNVAGSASGTPGFSGNGGPATAAQMYQPYGIGTDPAGDLYILQTGAGWASSILQEVTASASSAIPAAPGQTSSLSPAPGGITVTQPGGAQVTFYAQVNGACAAPYRKAGGYCALPQDINATLTYNSASQTYTYSPAAGTAYSYGWNGALTAETDAAGNTLTLTYQTPAPGSGQCPSGATSCTTITAASGRALVLALNASGLVTSVTDPLGRTWTYGYAGADLTSATDPMGNKTSYTYGAGSTGNPVLANDLLTITSPNAQPGGPDAGDATVNVYNAAGQVTSQTDPTGFKTTFSYCVNASTGNCMNASTGTGYVTVTDPDGNATIYYYVQGALAARADWTGTTLTSERDYLPSLAAGSTSGGTLLATATADGNGNITTSTYDASGNQTSSISPDGVGSQTGTTTAQFTSLNQASCTGAVQASSPCSPSQAGPVPVAPGGVITPPSSAPQGVTYTLFDTNGNELYSSTGVYEPGSNIAAYAQTTYQLFEGNTITLNGSSISCAASPPAPALPCATIDADGVVTQLAYDAQGDLVSSSTPDGNGSEIATTAYGYNADGQQTSMTSPDGNLPGANAGNYTTVTAYNNDGQKTSATLGDGGGHTVTPRQTQYGYDANGNQTTVQDARGYTTTTTYSADNQATLVTDPDDNATLTCYDGDGHVTQTVPPAGVAASNLTPASCPTSYPAGYGTRLASDSATGTFDASGNKTQETAPAPAGQTGHVTTTYTYDGAGNVLTVTAPPPMNSGPNQVTSSTYNAASQLVTQTTGYGTSAAATVSYCHDPNSDVTSVVYAAGNTAGAAPCETSSPYVVNSSSFPTQAGFQTTYSYDSGGELVSTTSPATSAAPSGATTTQTYDPAGKMLTRADPNGVTVTWTYTPLNKPATVSYSGSSAHSAGYGYDANGNKTSMTDATGSLSYVYDPFGELTSATNGAGQVTGYGYNADGQVASVTYPLPSNTWATTSTVNYTYDHADLLTQVTDFNGNAITIGDTAGGLPNSAGLGSTGDTIATTYDNTDGPSVIALKNGSTTLQSFTYTDSPASTILNEADVPSSSQSPAVYTYDAKGRVTSMTPGAGSTLNYGFDASSNLTTLPAGATGSYDKAGELTSATLSGTTTNYTSSADGQRLTAKQGSTTVASGTWNGAGQLTAYSDAAANMTAASYDGNGVRASATTASGTQAFVWNTVPAVPQLLMDSANAYIWTGPAAPAEQVKLTSGTITYLVSDGIGSVRGTVNNSGTLTGTTSYDAWGNPETTGGLTGATPFGYAGGYTDPTGLIYLINRYYDPAAGQFTSLDPQVSQTLAPYAYADGNPVTGTDRNGLSVQSLTDWVMFGISLWTFLSVRQSVCGSNWPVRYPDGRHNCYWYGDTGGQHLDWSSDGCSFPAPWQILPWWGGHARFYYACHRHDFGYRNFHEQRRWTAWNKLRIDVKFLNDMRATCGEVSWYWRANCGGVAWSYYSTVLALGQ